MSKSMIRAAKGEIPADLVLKNGSVLNVFSEEIVPCDVAIVDGRIVGLGSYEGEREIDCTGKYIAPGLIDAHVHIESSMVSPLEFTKYIIRKGTTGIVADPHEIVNVSGKRGMDYILDASEQVPADVYVMVPSSVPATNIDTNGAGKFLAEDMAQYKSHPRVLGLGEMMRFVDVLNEEPETLDKLDAFSDMVMDGHAPGISQKEIQAYRMAGIQDDHECSTGEEALEKGLPWISACSVRTISIWRISKRTDISITASARPSPWACRRCGHTKWRPGMRQGFMASRTQAQ